MEPLRAEPALRIRYGGYGCIGYYHVSDKYIALFSHFIPCGVWEAVYILDGLLKNRSDIRPDTLDADTQGQSEPVFALAHLLGIELMPRIRNWQGLDRCCPDRGRRCEHIDSLFAGSIDWNLIEAHLPGMLRLRSRSRRDASAPRPSCAGSEPTGAGTGFTRPFANWGA